VVMVGALSAVLDLDEDMLLAAVEKRVPPKARETNLRGFARGREIVLRSGEAPRPGGKKSAGTRATGGKKPRAATARKGTGGKARSRRSR